jgi:glycosyltransferase involved in cell wall biosynthesis
VVVVNDGSEDDSAAVLERLRATHPFLRVVTHRVRRGIADALRSGADAASGRVLVFYPADLQFLPSEIPSLVGPIRTGEADIVTGAKQGHYEKAFVSRVYNGLCRLLFGVRVTDLNAVKAYRREVADVVPPRPDWHRFMVVIGAADGFRVAERPVTLLPRRAGRSKFGIGRIPVGALDLLSVWFQLRFGRKPLLFFGLSGSILFALGLVVGIVAFVLRFGFGYGFRPLLNLVILLAISGIALFGFGFVGEMIAGMREEVRDLSRALDRVADRLERR